MNEVTKIDIACGLEVKNGQDVLVAKNPRGFYWNLWGSREGVIGCLDDDPRSYYDIEQEDSVLGLIGVVFSVDGGHIVSIDDWKLYDADFDAPQELLDQLQAWGEYEVTEDASEINISTSGEVSPEWEKGLEQAIEEVLGIKPKARKEKIKDAVLMVLVNIGASILFVMSSMLMFLFAVVNTHKTLVHINEYGMGSAEYLMVATALMLFALAWFGTERLFNRLVK